MYRKTHGKILVNPYLPIYGKVVNRHFVLLGSQNWPFSKSVGCENNFMAFQFCIINSFLKWHKIIKLT